jgi:hypothetical protein
MPRTKNVSAPGGGDDEDPPCPFRQVKGKTVYLEQQQDRKKRRLDRAARAALAAAAAAEQAERGDQLKIPSDQFAYRVRRLASRPRSSAPSTPATATTPPPTSLAPVTPVPSTTSASPYLPPPLLQLPLLLLPLPFLLHLSHLPASGREMRSRCDLWLPIPGCLIFSVLQRPEYVGSDTYTWRLGYRLRETLQQSISLAPGYMSLSSEHKCLHRLLYECTGFWTFLRFF